MLSRQLKLAIVDDYEVVVRGLADMLRSYTDLVEVVELNADTTPQSNVDIALYDTFAQHQRDSEGVAQLLANPAVTHVVVYTWNFDHSLADRTIAAGASGYVSKTVPAAQLVDVLQRVHRGEVVISPSPGPGRSQHAIGDWPGREEGLTARESEVLALITQGLSNQDIADLTILSINSIKSYIRSAYRKIGVTNRSHAILWGVEHGFRPDRTRIVNPDQPGS